MAEEDVRRSPRRRGRLGLVVLLLGLAIWFVRSRRAAANAPVQPWPGVQRVPALVPPVPAQQLRSPSRASATIAPSPMTVGSGTTAEALSTPPAQAVPVEPVPAEVREEPAQAAPEAPAAVDAAPEPVEPAEAAVAPAVSDQAASAAPVEPEPGVASTDHAAEAVTVPDEPVAPAATEEAKPVPASPPVSETAASMFEPAASAAPVEPAPAAPAAADVATTGSTSSPDDAETELLPVQPVSWARPVEPEPHSLFTPAPPRRATPRSDRPSPSPSPRRRKPSPSPQTATLPPGAVAAGPDGSAPDPEYTIKASTGSLLFHSPASPYFRRTKAEIWFRSAADARAAGFTEWTPKKRTES
jgi:hypothetical protein